MDGIGRRGRRAHRNPVAARPIVERFEAIQLLSGVIASLHPATSHGTGKSTLAAALSTPPSPGADAVNNQFVNPPTAFTPPLGQPTAKEQKREMFRGTFIGTYIIGGPRFTNQTATISIQAAGTSTAFLHGDIQVGIVTYPNSQPAYGQSTSYDRNINSNAALGLDLTGTGAVDREGRPTAFSFAIDDNASAGTFDEATAGSNALMTIKYISNGKAGKGVLDQGKAIVTVTGDIYTLGTVNIIGVLGQNNNLSSKKYQA